MRAQFVQAFQYASRERTLAAGRVGITQRGKDRGAAIRALERDPVRIDRGCNLATLDERDALEPWYPLLRGIQLSGPLALFEGPVVLSGTVEVVGEMKVENNIERVALQRA